MHATVFQVFYDFIETLVPTNILEPPDISSPVNNLPHELDDDLYIETAMGQFVFYFISSVGALM